MLLQEEPDRHIGGEFGDRWQKYAILLWILATAVVYIELFHQFLKAGLLFILQTGGPTQSA